MPSDVTADDVLDYVRPTARQKPDMIIIHTGANEFQKNLTHFKKLGRSLLH